MDKKKKDYLLFTLICQFLICALLFGSLWGLKRVNSDIYLTLKNEYYSNLNTNFDIFENSIKESKNEPLEKASEEVTENVPEIEQEEPVTDATKQDLSVEIKGEGGQDYSIESIDEVPDNVSVNSYVLSQKMVLPVKGVTTSDFGVRNHPIKNELRFHAGIDIAADSGTPIYAAFSGDVIVADYDEWNGYYIKLQHDGDIMTVYCHCKSLCVKKGDKVEAGDVIGYVGSTGSSTGPHLHFELRVNNVSYDPQAALDDAVNAV